MSIDVLEINRLRTFSANVGSALPLITCSVDQRAEFNFYPNTVNSNTYWCCWDSIFPAAPTGGTVLCVGCMRVGTDSYLRCGMCCAWTVPAGVTVAKFEVWGPGAGTLPGCCCSIQPFGMTGAYATICIPVVAGTVYTLCAGCAQCCYRCQTMAGSASCSSFVCISGSSPILVAFGGSSCRPWTAHMGVFNFPCDMGRPKALRADNCFDRYLGSCCGVANFSGGVQLCSYGESCISPTSNTMGIFPVTPVFETPAITSYVSTSNCIGFYGQVQLANNQVRRAVGVPQQLSEICLITGSCCGYVKHPPIPGFANSSQCCVSWSSTQATFGGYLCSPLQGSNYLTAPGSGGNMVYTVGGCNSNCGDSGRGGMVRVTYCQDNK